MATATLGGSSSSIKVTNGYPQRGILSPLLWYLVVDDLIPKVNGVEFILKDMRRTSVLQR